LLVGKHGSMGPRGFQSRLNLGNFKMRHYLGISPVSKKLPPG
jgi:hypothetical protein